MNASSSSFAYERGDVSVFIMFWPSKRLRSLYRWNLVVKGYPGIKDNITDLKKTSKSFTSLALHGFKVLQKMVAFHECNFF